MASQSQVSSNDWWLEMEPKLTQDHLTRLLESYEPTHAGIVFGLQYMAESARLLGKDGFSEGIQFVAEQYALETSVTLWNPEVSREKKAG